jgi:hypothetical protein
MKVLITGATNFSSLLLRQPQDGGFSQESR